VAVAIRKIVVGVRTVVIVRVAHGDRPLEIRGCFSTARRLPYDLLCCDALSSMACEAACLPHELCCRRNAGAPYRRQCLQTLWMTYFVGPELRLCDCVAYHTTCTVAISTMLEPDCPHLARPNLLRDDCTAAVLPAILNAAVRVVCASVDTGATH
jgi:hypothetical protein